MVSAGLYHIPVSYFDLAKSLGITHVECSIQRNPGNIEELNIMIASAHDSVLNCFIDPGFYKGRDKAFAWLGQSDLSLDDLIYLADEPNLNNISPDEIGSLAGIVESIRPANKTIISVSQMRPFEQFGDTADIIAIDYYGSPFDLIEVLKLAYRKMKLRKNHKGEIWGIIPLKGSAKDIKHHASMWSILGVKNFLFYSFDFDGNQWGEGNLSIRQDYQEAIKEIIR